MEFYTSTRDSKKFRKGIEATTKTVFKLTTNNLKKTLLKGYTEAETDAMLFYGFGVSILHKGRDGQLHELKDYLAKKNILDDITITENVPTSRPDKITAEDKEKLNLLKGLSTEQIQALLSGLKHSSTDNDDTIMELNEVISNAE